MAEEIEDLDSETQDESGEESTDNQSDEADAQLKELKEKNRQLYERAKKAEAEAKDFKTRAKELVGEKPKPEQEAVQEPDYGRLAYLNSLDVKHPDDQKAILDEAKRLNLPLSDVYQMEHIQTKLKVNRETREAQSGIPSSTGRSGGSSRQDVDYWVAKGGLPEDQALAEKVVNARMAKESQNKFADSMFNE